MCEVKQIMTHRVVTVGPDAPIREAVRLLLDHGVSGLPVVDENRKLLGVISEIDIIDLIYKADIDVSKVRDYMTRSVRTLDTEDSVDDAASIFCSQAIRRIPVTQDGCLVGILSRHDLIRFVRDVREQMALEQAAATVG
jgi:CBS domain-containing protein